MLPGVGHVAQIEAPEAVAAGVAGLWDGLAAGKMAADRSVAAPRRHAHISKEQRTWRYRRSSSRRPS